MKYEFSSFREINCQFIICSPFCYAIDLVLYLNVCLFGTNNAASSAYIAMRLIAEIGHKSQKNITNNVGPIPDPCAIERLMTSVNDLCSPNFGYWSRSVRKDTIHFMMLSAMLYFLSLFIRTRESTESKALEKSISKHRTYLLSSSIMETLLKFRQQNKAWDCSSWFILNQSMLKDRDCSNIWILNWSCVQKFFFSARPYYAKPSVQSHANPWILVPPSFFFFP